MKHEKIVEVLKKELNSINIVGIIGITETNRLLKGFATAIEQIEPEGDIDWDDISIEFWDRFKGVSASHQSIFNWFKVRLKKLTPQQPSEGEITARELNSHSILAERAGKFAIWLNENRWFNYKNGKWYYTFEHGTAISMESYEKNYTKTHTELYKLFLKELTQKR